MTRTYLLLVVITLALISFATESHASEEDCTAKKGGYIAVNKEALDELIQCSSGEEFVDTLRRIEGA